MDYYNTAKTEVAEVLREYVAWCEEMRNMSPRTIRTKKSILGLGLADMGVERLAEIDERRVNALLRGRLTGEFGRKMHPNGVVVVRQQIVAFLRWAKDTGLDVRARISYIALPKRDPVRRKFYTREEIAGVAAACDDLLAKVAILIAFDTGLRVAEVWNIRLDDIRGRVIQTVGKGRKLAFVYISEKTRRAMDELITKTGAVDYLFTLAEESKTPTAMVLRVKRAFEKCGFLDFQFHELRHSFATDLQRHGARIDEIQKLMRHSNVNITERYLHGLDGVLGDVWAKYKG